MIQQASLSTSSVLTSFGLGELMTLLEFYGGMTRKGQPEDGKSADVHWYKTLTAFCYY